MKLITSVIGLLSCCIQLMAFGSGNEVAICLSKSLQGMNGYETQAYELYHSRGSDHAQIKKLFNDQIGRKMSQDSPMTASEVGDLISASRSFQIPFEELEVVTLVFKPKLASKAVGVMQIHAYDPSTNSVFVGYALARKLWGRGIATNMLKRTLEYSFLTLKVDRVKAQVWQGNIASAKILMKNGFEKTAEIPYGDMMDDLYELGRDSFLSR